MHQLFIISGGPGAGKSTLLEALRQKAYTCFDEMARAVIREQLDAGTNLVPWDDLAGFSHNLFERICEQAETAKGIPLAFVDRSAVDVLAYLKYGDLPVSEDYIARIPELGYSKTVFFLPFWPEIYASDEERHESEEKAREISSLIKDTYIELGFEITEVPITTVSERLLFIENHIKNLTCQPA